MHMDNYLPTDYQSFIHKSRYARWLEKKVARALDRNSRTLHEIMLYVSMSSR